MAHVNQPYAEPMMYQPRSTSFFSKLTKGEIVWGVIALLAFFGSLGDGGAPVFSAVVVFIIIWSVSQREQSKRRIYNLLPQYPSTTLAFLSKQLDKDEKHVIKVLKIMILDEGAPIRLDLTNNTVTKVGKFYGEPVERQATETPSPSARQSTASESAPQSQQVEFQAFTPAASSKPVSVPMTDCLQCGSHLPVSAKFCHVCGVRQFK